MWSEAFFLKALLAGVGIAVVAAPIGCFVVWRRMAYFGESLAHSGLLGVAAGLLLGVDTTIGVVAVCLAMALLLLTLQRQRMLANDTLLGRASNSRSRAPVQECCTAGHRFSQKRHPLPVQSNVRF